MIAGANLSEWMEFSTKILHVLGYIGPGSGFAISISLVTVVILVVSAVFAPIFYPFLMLWNVIRWTLSALLMSAVVSTVYYFGPMVRQPFRLLSPGGLFTVAVWVVLGLAFRFYVNSFGGTGYELTYGTVGGVAILLLVFYLDALVLLIGAEINSETDYIILNVPRGSTNLYAGSTNLSSKSPNPDQNVLPK